MPLDPFWTKVKPPPIFVVPPGAALNSTPASKPLIQVSVGAVGQAPPPRFASSEGPPGTAPSATALLGPASRSPSKPIRPHPIIASAADNATDDARMDHPIAGAVVSGIHRRSRSHPPTLVRPRRAQIVTARAAPPIARTADINATPRTPCRSARGVRYELAQSPALQH